VKRAVLALLCSTTLACPLFAQSIGGNKVSQMSPASTPFSGTELLYIIQNGVSKRTTTGEFANFLRGNPNLQIFDPRYFGPGAKCDGVTDDYQAFLAAERAAEVYVSGSVTSRSGALLVPASGATCLISHGLALGNGVGVVGVGGAVNPGTNATVAQWGQAGSWLQSTDTVNPTISMGASGNFLSGVNFIRSQPTPSSTPSTPYTPTNYPFEISDAGSMSWINNVKMIGVTNGILLGYTQTSGGGTYTWLSHLDIDAMNVSFQTSYVNDTIYVSDVHARSYFYAGNSNLVTYREANAVGWAMGYTDNAMVDGYECFQVASCIAATNQTLNVGSSVTHSGYNLQIAKLDCNLVVTCLNVASGSTISGRITDIIAQQDGGLTNTLFNIPSDKVDLQLGSVNVVTTGATVMALGSGAGGSVQIGTLNLGTQVNGTSTYGYSVTSAGQPAFSMSANAKLSIGQRRVVRNTTAGAFIAGSGADNVAMPTTCWQPFATATQASVNGTGSAVTFTTDNLARSEWAGTFLQVRIQAQPNVTANAAGNGVIQSSGYGTSLSSSTISCTYSTASTGVKTCDSGWTEVADSGGTFGHFALTAPAATTSQFGPLMICGR